ncbi:MULTISPECIES: DinB family protein [unclassified Pseudoalteromonas]|uniref:DinB family protein n=1 Tax=unclassified Pseudoalteromonas TaxID=194690 RepID=UPI0020969308|nr:DinB family protein [Pseudoalteromonas sp. XMcav2-N]MCO7188179.1 DinB family protein [Pseudoalteromonas sp. XMcav2-N]
MNQLTQFGLLADYNQWMNQRVYQAAARLSEGALKQDLGAFFGSVLGTLNHLVVADTIWLKRFASNAACSRALQPMLEQPDPASLDQCLFQDLTSLTTHRQWLDKHILCFISELQESELDTPLTYRNTKGVVFSKPLSSVLVHFFNHQTHHRGQVSTLFSQLDEDIGDTDLLLLIGNVDIQI